MPKAIDYSGLYNYKDGVVSMNLLLIKQDGKYYDYKIRILTPVPNPSSYTDKITQADVGFMMTRGYLEKTNKTSLSLNRGI